MAVLSLRVSRRSLLASSVLAVRAIADQTNGPKGQVFESDWRRYSDPATELEVFRLTDPSYTSTLPASTNRVISRNSGFLLFCCDRSGAAQAFRMDLKSGETRQLTDRANLDGASLNLLPDGRSFCYFADRTLYRVNLGNLREAEIYMVPEGWERGPGLCTAADSAHVFCIERRGDRSRLRSIPLAPAAARTVLETPLPIADPVERPLRGQILYRETGKGLWLVNSDGRQNRALKLAAGTTGPANWAPDGRTLLYLNFPDDAKQLNAIREYAPDEDKDKIVARTSQYVQFGFNRDTSVFVGASRNVASPVILLLLRVTQRERTLCEHKASHPDAVAPMFAPDAQRIYFQSDRHGKPALYSMHIERLVEKIGDDKE
ncbi:MAG TPA: oligogalacturonate lyase family protein [Bryobacteraceae bacterium]|nr:oligogalacturonate lyase family protein [Bryobacteraceae bacterium]